MSWCDKLASTPAVGFGLDWHFAPASDILDTLSPMLDKLVARDQPTFTVERPEQFSVSVTTLDGFQYGVDPNKVHVSFHHRMKPKFISGGPPVMEMLSRPLPYTSLLPEVSKKLVDITMNIPGPRNRFINRVGIVSTTVVSPNEIPPGISRFIDYMSRPWPNGLRGYNFNIASEIQNSTHWTDQCIHNISRPEDPEELITLQFDWQRIFHNGRARNKDVLTEILSEAQKNALKYFEELVDRT